MTHGDFDAAYLRALALDADGRPRFRRLSFAAHFDSLMRGRRGMPRPRRESDLHPFRRAFVAMFADLRRDHGVASYLAHNMTVTPANLGQVAEVAREASAMGYQMLSFQPAAHVGDERRWKEDYRRVGIDDVWRELERGLGQRVAWEAVQFGHPACNRTAMGLRVGARWVPWLDPDEPGDRAGRDRFQDHLGGMSLTGSPVPVTAVKVLRAAVRHPADVLVAARWLARFVRRAGAVRLLGAWRRGELVPMTYVVHRFMDADAVQPAWQGLREGVLSEDPAVRETQDRLRSCMYAMAHPDTGELVPACVQHSVLDPGENEQLRRLLPLTVVG